MKLSEAETSVWKLISEISPILPSPMLVAYVPDILINFVHVKDEKHTAAFKIAQLENEIDPGLNGVQLIKHRFFFRSPLPACGGPHRAKKLLLYLVAASVGLAGTPYVHWCFGV